MERKLRIAMVGTRGVPAAYGGFETCAEEVSAGLVRRGHDVTVYCRRGNVVGDPAAYQGVTLRYAGHVAGKSLGTLTHALMATLDVMRRDFDVLLYFNAATAPMALLAKLVARRPVVLNVDGLESKRRKWGRLARAYSVLAEWLSGKVADRIIADSRAIQRYYLERWHTPTTFLPYGAHVEGPRQPELLGAYDLRPDSYFLVVGRLEPENNADLIVEAFRRLGETDKQLVIVGGAGYRSSFVERLRAAPGQRVRFLGPIYRAGHLRELYCGAFAYVHGHEVGGTNPALLQALGHGCCVVALDVPFNTEVVADAALLYDKDPDRLAAQLQRLLADPEVVQRLRRAAVDRVRQAYRWDQVVAGYERLLVRAAAREYHGTLPADAAW
jgi:glycosyltransferase involved in cell wall biosynthesis